MSLSNPAIEQLEQQKTLMGVITQIRQPLELSEIFQRTVTEVRQLLKADRVAIFRFNVDWEGEFISEDVASGWRSALNEPVYDHCFGEQFAPLYAEGRVQAVADIYEVALSDCHAAILSKFQVRANLVVPLLKGNLLWGLLCIHQCSGAREWKQTEVEFIEQIAEHLTVAIQQAGYIESMESQAAQLAQWAQRERMIAEIVDRIRQSLDIDTIFQTTTQEVRHLLSCDRVAIFQFYPDGRGDFVAESFAEGWQPLVNVQPLILDTHLRENQGGCYRYNETFAVDDIYQAGLDICHIQLLEQFQAKAFALAPLMQGDKLWGLIAAYQNTAARNWHSNEIDFLAQIGKQMGIALQLAETAARQKALATTIDKIRQSLDINTIFQTTTQEVRQLLKADRVAIFQFYPDWSGDFVAESFAEGWEALVGIQPKIADTYLQETQGGRYRQNETSAVDDIYQAGLLDCHIQLLEQFQAKAYVIAPIWQGDKLWGLIAAYQNSITRNWQAYEVELLVQVGTQMGVALQHHAALKEARTQTERQKALTGVITRIRQSVELDKIFQTTAIEVRQLLTADRVGVFRFDPAADWEGEFVAEDINNEFRSALTHKVHDHCFSESFVDYYQKGRVNVINDIYENQFKQCYIEILERFQVRANVVAPLRQGERLWGLLCVHQCASGRNWQPGEIEFISQIADQLSVALTQDDYLKQVKNQAVRLAEVEQRNRAMERQKLLAHTIDQIRKSLDISTIFQTTTHAVRKLLEVERVAIYRFNSDWSGRFVADSIIGSGVLTINPQPISIIGSLQADNLENIPRNETFVPISQGDKLWGLLVAYQHSQPRYWQEEEVNLLAQVGTQLGIALQQAELLEQTQRQTAELTQTLQELKETQTQLIQGEKMAGLGQLVAGVAHEINNPVNFIFGNLSHVQEYSEALLKIVQMYQNYYPEPVAAISQELQNSDINFIAKDLPKILDSMQMGTERIRDIVLSLRNFSRLDEAEVKAVDLHEGLNSSLLILGHRLKGTSEFPPINIVTKYGNLPLVKCYPAQVNQVFMNILTNAIDALEEHWKNTGTKFLQIQVCTEVVKENAMIKICDNGPGIPEIARSRIFEPFFTTKAVGKGTGLGLPICYQIIVEKHGGKIEVSTPETGGTEFIISLPLHGLMAPN